MDWFQHLSSFIPHIPGGFHLLDIIILCVVLFYVHESYFLGFTIAFSDLLSFIISFVTALQFYTTFSGMLTAFFALPIGIANAISFFILALVSEIAISIVFRKLLRRLPGLPHGSKIAVWFKQTDHVLGIVPGLLSAFIILTFLLTIIVAFPSSPAIKKAVDDSMIASKLLSNSYVFEKQLNSIFGGALSDTLNFLTVEPKSDKTVQLHFAVKDGSVDEQAEQDMINMVNHERVSNGLGIVKFDAQLRNVARAHSQDMLMNGYFSHQSQNGRTPFDRMEDAGIKFTYAGENLALAPTTSLAMQGLMNSPGHRANILHPHFTKIGIGVIDGGIYGKMFSQEFSD